MTQDLGDSRVFEVIHFADLTTRNIYVIGKLYFSLKSCINNSVTREKVIVRAYDLILLVYLFSGNDSPIPIFDMAIALFEQNFTRTKGT